MTIIHNIIMGLNARKPAVCEQQRHSPASADMSDQRLCYYFFEKYHI